MPAGSLDVVVVVLPLFEELPGLLELLFGLSLIGLLLGEEKRRRRYSSIAWSESRSAALLEACLGAMKGRKSGRDAQRRGKQIQREKDDADRHQEPGLYEKTWIHRSPKITGSRRFLKLGSATRVYHHNRPTGYHASQIQALSDIAEEKRSQ